MAPPLSAPHGSSDGAMRVMINHGRQLSTRLGITGLSAAAIVVGLAFHAIVAVRKFFIGWATLPRRQPGPLPSLVAAPVWVIDALDGALRRVSGSVGRVFHTVESPLRRALAVSANRIVALEGRG
jgi:hypothetical protein